MACRTRKQPSAALCLRRKAIANRLFRAAKIVSKYFVRRGKVAGSKFRRLPLGKQLLLIAGVVSILYLLWRWFRNDDVEKSSREGKRTGE
jgi:hypothetical protein